MLVNLFYNHIFPNKSCFEIFIVPVSKPSKVLDRYNAKRKKQHEETLELMRNKRMEINEEIDTEIRNETAIVEEKIREIELDISFHLQHLSEELENVMLL